MARGGARAGAGRRKGSINRVSAAAREAARASGETPLDYMLRVMRDTKAKQQRRDDMAKAAAPFVHPRLAAAVLKVNDPTNPWEEIFRLVDGKSRGLPGKSDQPGG